MRRGASLMASVLFCLVGAWVVGHSHLLGCPPTHSQDLQYGDIPFLELSFGQPRGRAGEEVGLPISVTSDANLEEPFKITLSFSPTQLTFKKLKTGLLALKAGWTLHPLLKEAWTEDDTSVLEISVAPNESKFFPSGIIAYAYFGILETVPNGDIILDSSLQPAGTAPFQVKVKAEPAKISVYTELLYGCFFYMH